MNGKRKMNSSNAKESFTSTRLEYRFLSMFHLIISNVQEPKWQEFVRNQLTEHYLAAIQEEMFDLMIMSIYRKEHFKENLFKFSSLCTRTAWLRLFDASINFVAFVIFSSFYSLQLSLFYSGHF